MSEEYFYVERRDGGRVEAKYLKDLNGNYFINPVTGDFYTVPANFDLKTFIDKYSALGTAINPMTGQPESQPRLTIYSLLTANFRAGHQDDIQRARGYGGTPGAKPGKDFVWAFTGVSHVAVSKMMKKENRP